MSDTYAIQYQTCGKQFSKEPEIAANNLHAEISLLARATSVDPVSLLANGSISSPGETFSTALLYRAKDRRAERTSLYLMQGQDQPLIASVMYAHIWQTHHDRS